MLSSLISAANFSKVIEQFFILTQIMARKKFSKLNLRKENCSCIFGVSLLGHIVLQILATEVERATDIY